MADGYLLDDHFRLYIFDFPTQNPTTPHYACIDFGQKESKTLFGFGKRYQAISKQQAKGAPGWAFTSYLASEDRIWVGSPYHSNLEIYDKEGRLLRGVPSGLNGLQHADFDNINLKKKKARRNLFYKLRNYCLLQVDDLILAIFLGRGSGFIFNIYDLNGRLLKKDLKKPCKFGLLKDSYNGLLMSNFETHIEQLEYYSKTLEGKGFQLLLDSGWNPKNFSDDNPYIAIIQPKRNDLNY